MKQFNTLYKCTLNKARVKTREHKDMNHRAESVIRHVVKRDKGGADDLFSQSLDFVEVLLQGQTCISQDMETRGKRAT